jgi:aryl-alcohol dehydrogenase-like predicted oxidoreductase
MKYRKLGKSGFNVSEIGFGTWPLSGGSEAKLAYGKTNDAESKRALRTAYELGINFYDTSDFYGFGHVENLMGEVFEDVRKDIIIVTKVGMISVQNDQDFSTEHMVKCIDESLKRLRTDYIDVYLLHNPTIEMLEDGRILSLLNTFKSQGKILTFGVSTRVPSDGFGFINKFGTNIIEFNYNMIDHRAQDIGLFDLCRKEEVATIIRTPLGKGIISGEFKFNSDPYDTRNEMSRKSFEKVNKICEEMFAGIKDKTNSRAQTALRYCLSEPNVTSSIPGMKTVDEVKNNVLASDLGPLSEEELQFIAEQYKRSEQ